MEQSSHFLSEATQATLLLCAPLVAARVKEVAPLSPGEFNELVAALAQQGRHVSDFLGNDSSLLAGLHPQFDTDRLRALLGRGFALSLSVEKWTSHGFWVLSRDDAEYPRRLQERLKHLAPVVIYGCGERALLETGGVAIVGS